ncbi:hypothetical protein [Caballeronia sp. Lep1P3]|uniref:hypothetical protein n=1 Tax=Caballeronia sp. Lep1P3 TaxID=2878150 RepID=UPI001FD037FD|nr:hypothetical protein [Caballeronia sp. Lep1P3]
MNTWLVVGGVWAMFAVCVVLFVRGASSRADRAEETRDKAVPRRAARKASRAEV